MSRFIGLVVLSWLACATLHALDERRQPLEPVKPKDQQPLVKPEVGDPELTKEEKEKQAKEKEEKVILKELKGLAFVGSKDDIEKVGSTADVVVKNVPLLDSDAFKEKMRAYLGKPATLKIVREIAKGAVKHFREQDRPFVHISLPEQEITQGVIQFLVIEGRVNEIKVEGNGYFSDKQYSSKVNLKQGDRISEKMLIRDINRINESIFRSVRPAFTPGKEPGTTDLLLKAEERFPVRFYTGYEDTGTQNSGLDRLIQGFNWGNGFMAEHEIGYQFASDLEFDRLISHSGYWRIPLPHRHGLAITGGHSVVQAPINQDLDSSGTTFQISLRYIAPLPEYDNYRHQAHLGFDYKETNSNLEFGGTEIFSSKVHIIQAALSYLGNEYDRWGSTSFSAHGYFSPSNMSYLNRDDAYRQARASTQARYEYLTGGFERVWKLPKKVTLVNKLQGQVTSERLQSTEQFLLGGFNTVRGYDDRLVNSDQGLQLSCELRSPNFKLGKIKDDPRFESHMQFHIFWDWAHSYNLGDINAEQKRTVLESVGGGIHYTLGTHVNVRFDYGHRLRNIGLSRDNSDHGRIHLGVVVSY